MRSSYVSVITGTLYSQWYNCVQCSFRRTDTRLITQPNTQQQKTSCTYVFDVFKGVFVKTGSKLPGRRHLHMQMHAH